jgi:dihydrofolate synthase/folylpolyglutamate synthase
MTYKETTDWMFNQLPMFQTIGASAYKKDLSNTLLLAAHLHHPETKFRTIHVGGTNGKGSTSSMLASILQEAGYKVGLYTSPHLKDFRERIRINGEMISEEFVEEFIAQNKSFFEANQLSFFEMTVGLAFEYFEKEQVDVAVIEVGMGGRLDSTNIITPLLSVITNIGLDHTQFLGSTLREIAKEKAGIIKPNVPIVIGEYCDETKEVFEEKAKALNSPLFFASTNPKVSLECALKGDYQESNLKTVVQTIELAKDFFEINENHIKNGLKNVIENTGLLGRWQVLNEHPKVVCDTAHNSHGLKIVLKQIEKTNFKQLHIVLGVVNDKDLDSILPLFPKNANYYFCKPDIPRGLDAKILEEKAKEFSLNGILHDSVSSAYKTALATANKEDFIYIGGSTFVVAEVI